jgi:hypothetical protein
MSSYLVPLISVVVGTFLGLFTSLLTSSVRQRQDVTLRLLDEYFQVRKELVDAITDLANMNIRDQLDSSRRAEYRYLVSRLFYKHYDFLPKEVLQAMTLLYVCLNSPSSGLFTLRGKGILPMKDEEVIPFIESCSLYDNTKYLAPLALKSDDPTIRGNQALILHARNVLYTLNKYASIKNLLRMTKELKK